MAKTEKESKDIKEKLLNILGKHAIPSDILYGTNQIDSTQINSKLKSETLQRLESKKIFRLFLCQYK